MDNRFGKMKIFLRVVERGSFSVAARLSMTTPSTVSKLIGRVENRLGVRHLGSVPRLIVGTPDYLKRFGRPETVDDLEHHRCLGFNFRRAAPVWPLQERGRIVDRIVRGPLLANNGETVRRAAIRGAGLARLAEYHVREDLAAGCLVEVLAESGTRDGEEIHALYQGGKQVPQRIRVFLDFVIPRLQASLRPLVENL